MLRRVILVGTLLGTLTVLAAEESAPFRPTAQERIVPAGAKLEVIWNEGDFTEGPATAPEGDIYFTDIGNRILRFDALNGKTAVYREPSGKANGLTFNADGRLIACEGAAGGNRRISITEKNGTVRTLADRWQGKRFNSPNDLSLDKNGRVYFTDPRYVGDEQRELDFEGVFLVAPSGEVTLATRDVQKPNGIAVSQDGRHVYVADNNGADQGKRQLVRFAVRDDGTLGDKEVLFDFGPAQRGIDGMTLDRDGNVYAAAGSGAEAGVYVFDPQGKPLALVPTPGDPTNCEFGTGADRNVLYVTAAGPVPEAGAKRRYAL